MKLTDDEKAARVAVRAKIKAGIYTMPAVEHIRSTNQFYDEVMPKIDRQLTAHHSVPINSETFSSLSVELREERDAYFDVVWKKFYPFYHVILKANHEHWAVTEAERTRDRPPRWWRQVGDFHEVAIRDDGSLWNPNNYPEAAVRQAIADAEARLQARKQESIKRGVEKRAQRREQRIWAAADAIRTGAGIGPRDTCFCCRKALTDPPSIARGIGPECWEGVLRTVENETETATC
jgi:uncharacterized protein DUF6011